MCSLFYTQIIISIQQELAFSVANSLEEKRTLKAAILKRGLRNLSRSKKALAIPVTFLILFASSLVIISVTYYFAVERVNSRSQFLQVSMAKQEMYQFDDAILSILWQPGSSQTLEFGSYGGTLTIRPSGNVLVINITDGNNISATIFNASIGQVAYKLPYSEESDTGLFLKGDSRAIVNQSGSQMTQLSIQNGAQHPEVQLSYRPITSIISIVESNRTVNDLRMYVVNLNSSQNIELMGEIPLILSCTAIQNAITSYNVSYQLTSLTVTATLSGNQGQVSIPMVSDPYGTIINVELVTCNVKIEREIR